MKVEIKIQPELREPYAVIYTGALTDEVQAWAARMEAGEGRVVAVSEGERIVILERDEIYMVRVEDEKTAVYTAKHRYLCGKRLYELEASLGETFMRISKSTLVNLKKIDYVEPSFGGALCLILKNGGKDYISRRYLKEFKGYLGI